MNGQENIASFFANVEIVFNFDEQLSKIQEQLRSFAARLGPITIPVRLTGLTDASIEMAAMRGGTTGAGFGIPRSGRRGGLSESQWEKMTTQSMLAQGYTQGEGGWYKAGAASVSGAAGAMGSDLMGFAKTNALFFGAFAAVGDLMKGAQLDRQLAVLKVIIPAQQQYNEVFGQLQQTANYTGTNIGDTVKSFVAFSNAAKNANIDMGTAVQSFKALSIGISGTSSQNQAYRIFGDYVHLIMNTQKVSMARLSRTDLGTYLNIPGLLLKLPQFKGDDMDQMSKAFDNLTKAEQLTAINTVLLTAYQAEAAAGSDTLAGRWTAFTNSLEIMGGVLVTQLTPSLKLLVDALTLVANVITYVLTELGSALAFVEPSLGRQTSSAAQSLVHGGTFARAFTMASVAASFSEGPIGIVRGVKTAEKAINLIITDKTSGGVNASASQVPSNQARQIGRY